MLGVSVVGYGVVTALTAVAGGIGSLAVFRFLTGVGGGGELSIGSPYVTEVWGRNSRSIGIGIMFVFYPLGYLFSISNLLAGDAGLGLARGLFVLAGTSFPYLGLAYSP